MPTNDLHALPSFAVLYHSTNFVRKCWWWVGGRGAGVVRAGITGLISFAAYSWNTILRPVP